MASIPFCASACLVLLNESAIGACSNCLATAQGTCPTRFRSYLWEIDAERVHIQAVQKTSETLAESRQTLVHQLQVHEIGLEVGHGVCELRKLRLQSVDGGLIVSGIADAVAVAVGFSERRARAGSQGRRGARRRPRSRRRSWCSAVHVYWGA